MAIDLELEGTKEELMSVLFFQVYFGRRVLKRCAFNVKRFMDSQLE
jgi:hypothetical protein